MSYAQAICQKVRVSEVILLTHTKHQLFHTSLSGFLGEQTAKALGKGPLSIGNGIRIRAETMRTILRHHTGAVVLVYYAESNILDVVDGLSNVAGIVAVPDLPGTGDEWSNRWGAKVHGEERKAPVRLIDDPVIICALEYLTSMINLSTGLGHPRDKEYANQTLRILRAKGHADPSERIKSWAIREGWKPDHAGELETLSRKIWSLKSRPSLAGFVNPNDRYAQWSAEAAAKG